MIDCEMIFKRLRDVALKNPARSERFKKFVKDGRQGMEIHHVFGSAMSLKSSDYLVVAVEKQTHRFNQDNREWIIKQMPQAVENLLNYVALLEYELSERKGKR